MKTSKCFVNDLKELMKIHNVKSFDFTGNIVNGKLKIEDISATDFDDNELYSLGNRTNISY